MKCLICRQAEFVDGFTSIIFERGEFKLLFNHVPAQVCPNCGEAIVDEGVMIRLLNEAEVSFAQGMPEDVRQY
jgi:YgiT-type zinc finger domain-containing protein